MVDAGNEADTYIGQRYDLPLPSTPPVLRGKVVDIAVWNLFARRGLGDADEVVRERYKNAVKWLEQLAVGKVSLPLPVSGGGDDGSGGRHAAVGRCEHPVATARVRPGQAKGVLNRASIIDVTVMGNLSPFCQ